MEVDVSIPQDKVKEISEVGVAHVNAIVTVLRRIFLVEDLVDSIKFGVMLWGLTYLGAWFNGMTLIIIGEKIIASHAVREQCFIFFFNNLFWICRHMGYHVIAAKSIEVRFTFSM